MIAGSIPDSMSVSVTIRCMSITEARRNRMLGLFTTRSITDTRRYK